MTPSEFALATGPKDEPPWLMFSESRVLQVPKDTNEDTLSFQPEGMLLPVKLCVVHIVEIVVVMFTDAPVLLLSA